MTNLQLSKQLQNNCFTICCSPKPYGGLYSVDEWCITFFLFAKWCDMHIVM